MTENGKAPWADCESREDAYRRGQADLVNRIEELLARLWASGLREVLGKRDTPEEDDHQGGELRSEQ